VESPIGLASVSSISFSIVGKLNDVLSNVGMPLLVVLMNIDSFAHSLTFPTMLLVAY
jgi:hypothetical protein